MQFSQENKKIIIDIAEIVSACWNVIPFSIQSYSEKDLGSASCKHYGYLLKM